MNAIKELRRTGQLSREDLERTRLYKFAGKIYHRGLIGSRTRLEYRWRYLSRKLAGTSLGKTILCYPDTPDHSQLLYKICNFLGCKMTDSITSRPDLIIAFEDTTKRAHSPILADLAEGHRVVNQGCDDISKIKVESVFRDVFGYGTFVDPEAHQGLCVMKSNANAMHDGQLVECPIIAARSGVIYQRLINNAADDEVLDIRVPIIGTDIPFVYLKYRSLRSRFSNKNTRVTMSAVDAVFTSDEVAKIKRFADELGLGFGELDILRDVDDGDIYIVDVNNTPCGPPNHLCKEESRRAVQILSHSFDTQFLTSSNRRDADGRDVR
ncbi:hypothetical protein [Mycobacterium sp. 3519A]|uniref:hypothetical protein n=1 Tax=Mycobacterium sp. 3519A TaxID=2057184 RepID=UPI000C7A74B3|nr:hypothetical protein [Mycobacterium sp. 3519A]